MVERLNLSRVSKDGSFSMYGIVLGTKQIGEIGVSQDKDAIHMEFVELDPKYRGQGYYQQALNLLIKRNPQCKYFSGEASNKRVLNAANKVFGPPKAVEGDIDSLPEEASYSDEGRIQSDKSILVRWDRPKET